MENNIQQQSTTQQPVSANPLAEQSLPPVQPAIIATTPIPPFGIMPLLLVLPFIFGAIVYGIEFIEQVLYIHILVQVFPLTALTILLELVLVFFCIVTIINIFRRKKVAIKTAYITLGVFMGLCIAICVAQIGQAAFFSAEISSYGFQLLVIFTIYFIIASAIFIFLRRSKQLKTALYK